MTTKMVFAESPLDENQSRFGEVDGNVQVLSQGSAQWVDAHVDLPLEAGDEIRVDEDSHAELSLAKDVLIYLDAGSDVIIGHITTTDGHLGLTQGALFGKVETEGPRGIWEFETPMGVCTVRGTEFAIIHTDEEGTHLGVFKGNVDLSPAETAEGRQPSVMIAAHEEGVLQKRKPLKTLKSYSTLVQGHFADMSHLQKRFQNVSQVWVPFTVDYRKELRRKFIAPVSRKSHAVRKPVQRRTKRAPQQQP